MDSLPNLLDLYANAPHQTFPTPSELLSELSTNNSQPKSHRRRRRQNIGLTDPDTISSHDKKRNYLLSLEGYVVYLHEQLTLIGAKPLPLERVSSYHGLNSRSIRTLLIHLENTVRDLQAQTLEEEHVFLNLRNQAVDQDAADAAAAESVAAAAAAATATDIQVAEQDYNNRRHSLPSYDYWYTPTY